LWIDRDNVSSRWQGRVMQVHHFFPGDHETHDGRRLCEACGDVESRPVHEVPVTPVAAIELDARRLGENEWDQRESSSLVPEPRADRSPP
jgi:hypothetical protein